MRAAAKAVPGAVRGVGRRSLWSLPAAQLSVKKAALRVFGAREMSG